MLIVTLLPMAIRGDLRNIILMSLYPIPQKTL
jgi:hypothetical protein